MSLASWALALLSLLLGARADTDVRYFQSALEPEGDLLESVFVDLEGDDRLEICLAVLAPGGRRELRFHRLGAAGWDPDPFRVVDVLDEALAFGFANVRAEAGVELFFLTAGGAWSYSLEHDGYRGNVQRLAEEPLLFDVPDPHDLPHWTYVMPQAGGDRLLLPGSEGYSIWGPSGAGEPGGARRYRCLARFARLAPGSDEEAEEHERNKQLRIGSGGIRLGSGNASAGPLLLDDDADRQNFLSSQRAYRAPALLDVNGDGALDLVASNGSEIAFHRGGGRTFPARPGRTEALPDYLDRDQVELWFRDLDGDGDLDVLAQCSDESEGMEPREVSLLALLNDGVRMLPERPQQILRFKTHELEVRPTDVDGDGRIDLAVREYLMPSLVGTVTGVEIEISDLVFLGTEGARPFARKPVLKESRTFDEESILEGITNREVEMDFDGDGLADWVEIDVQRRVSVRRMQRESSFFGGDSWEIESSAWLRFEDFGDIDSMEVRDLNGDGLGDVTSHGERGLSFLFSSIGGGARR